MCLIIILGKNEIASTICFVVTAASFSLFFLIKTYPPAPITTTSYSCSTTGYLLPEAAVVSGRATLEDLTHLDVARRDCKSIRNFSLRLELEL